MTYSYFFKTLAQSKFCKVPNIGSFERQQFKRFIYYVFTENLHEKNAITKSQHKNLQCSVQTSTASSVRSNMVRMVKQIQSTMRFLKKTLTGRN